MPCRRWLPRRIHIHVSCSPLLRSDLRVELRAQLLRRRSGLFRAAPCDGRIARLLLAAGGLPVQGLLGGRQFGVYVISSMARLTQHAVSLGQILIALLDGSKLLSQSRLGGLLLLSGLRFKVLSGL